MLTLMAAGGAAMTANAAGAPVLISEPTSTRAVALSSPTFLREPFSTMCAAPVCEGQRTRVMLFALNLTLQPGEDLSSVSAEAEDGAHRLYSLKVEYAGKVPGFDWLNAVVVKLDDNLGGDVGDVLVRISYRGVASNRVRVGIGHVGDGLADDVGALPTPAPPFTLSGLLTDGPSALAGVTLMLSGGDSRGASYVTDVDGRFSFGDLLAGSSYTLAPSKPCYSFTPVTLAFNDLYGNSSVNINGERNRIEGRVLDAGGQAVGGATIMMTGALSGTTQSDSAGNYFFDCVTPGDYLITPSHVRYNFNPGSVALTNLTGKRMANFTGTLKTYTIRGHVASDNGANLAGVTVTLGGAQARVAQTDNNGDYAFADLTARGDYTITVSRIHYSFATSTLTFKDLTENLTANFTGIVERFDINGQIISEGRPLAGITVVLTGAQTVNALTDANGAYRFSVPAESDYTITPSEKNYYAFMPSSRSLINVSAAQTASFDAHRTLPSSPQRVLEYDGTPKTVDYGYYFEPDRDLGHFYWEFWAMPGANAGATYLVSDGYGGAHALLFGVSFYGQSEPNRYQLFGDIWDSSHVTTYFSSDEGPAVGEWGHCAVGWDGREIVTYFNGVPVGRTAFIGPRRSGGFINGGGRLLIGGSDHNNFIGRIAQFRGYEDANPRENTDGVAGDTTHAAFAPETIFRLGGNALSNFFNETQTVDDLSTGLYGSLHPGLLRGTLYPYGLLTFCEECPRPQYVIDPTAPDFSTATDSSQRQYTVPSAPGGALIFDSFTRKNSTYILEGNGGLGATEGGAQAGQMWRTDTPATSRQPFGILNERAVLLANKRALAWVSIANAPNSLDIRVDRHPGRWGAGLDTGLSFRVEDASNYFFAYTGESNQDAGVRALTVGYVQGGQRTELATGVLVPRDWQTLRVVTSAAGAFSVYADGTLLYSSSSVLMSNATGAGLYNDHAGLGLANRWDSFTIY